MITATAADAGSVIDGSGRVFVARTAILRQSIPTDHSQQLQQRQQQQQQPHEQQPPPQQQHQQQQQQQQPVPQPSSGRSSIPSAIH